MSHGLEALAPPWVEIEYRARFGRRRTIRLRQVTLGDLSAFLSAVTPAIVACRAAEDLDSHDDAVMQALALTSDAHQSTIKRMPKAALAAAVMAMINLHPDVFEGKDDPKEDASPDDPTEASASWPDAIAILLAAGHRMSDILGYTLGQAREHLAAAARQQNQAQARAIVASRFGLADGRAVDREIRRLMRSGNRGA